MTRVPGSSQPGGAVGWNMPQAPKTASVSAPAIRPGTTARNGLGAPSSEPDGEGCRKAARVRLFANV